MDFFEQIIVPNFNYWVYVILMMIGLYAMIAKNNLMKKLIGMAIFQTAIILFYTSIGVKEGANIPILDHHLMPGESRAEEQVQAEEYANPLPHVLMLTAIVVGVATLGLALAISQKIYREYGSLEEDDILAQIKPEQIR
jgi:multicomponent Na+:H+ antiporter subunit C